MVGNKIVNVQQLNDRKGLIKRTTRGFNINDNMSHSEEDVSKCISSSSSHDLIRVTHHSVIENIDLQHTFIKYIAPSKYFYQIF